jgi:ligand-binding SRPBCC domain-containing protein
MHILKKKIIVSAAREEVFNFFSDAWNLERITPRELNFSIVTERPFEIKKGALIEYRLKLFGLRFKWLTIISLWDPPEIFVDEQIQGPYKYWKHTHRFTEVDEGTLIEDEVQYKLPLYPFGELAHPLIKLQLKRIFNYREKAIADIFKM